MKDKPHSSQNTRRVRIKDSAVLKEQEGVFGIFLLWCGLFHESQDWQCLNKELWSPQGWPLCPLELWPGDPHMHLWSARSSQVETDKCRDGRNPPHWDSELDPLTASHRGCYGSCLTYSWMRPNHLWLLVPWFLTHGLTERSWTVPCYGENPE